MIVRSIPSCPHRSTGPAKVKAVASDKPAMIHLDIDHTLISWADRENQIPHEKGLKAAVQSLQKHKEKAIVGISTARALAETTRLASLLSGVPIDFIATNNGQQLFLNEDNLPTEDFIAGLELNQADAEWNQTLRQNHGWNPLKAHILLQDQLTKAGLQAVPNPNPKQTEQLYKAKGVELRVHPETSFFKFRTNNKKAQETVDQFMDNLQSSFQDNGLQCHEGQPFRWGRDWVRSLIPKGPSKTALLEHLVERSPNTELVVTAGDRLADGLEPDTIAGRPNLRVVAGARHETRPVRETPGVYSTKKGHIAPGLDAQMSILDQLA